MTVELCDDPFYFDAKELSDYNTLTAGEIVHTFLTAAEKSLRDSGQFKDAQIIKSSKRFIDTTPPPYLEFDGAEIIEGIEPHIPTDPWGDGYADRGIGTLDKVTDEQKNAIVAASNAGYAAMMDAVKMHTCGDPNDFLMGPINRLRMAN